MSRAVIIRMRKKAPHEHIDPYRQRFHEAKGHALRDKLARWASIVHEDAEVLVPAMPKGIEDRNADVWEPLIAVADLAGGSWPSRARDAAIELIASAKANSEPTLGVQLLADIRNQFGDKNQLSTAKLIECLVAMDEAPWGDLKGRKLDARTLSKLLREYGIKSVGIRIGDGSTPKGYKKTAFHDAWVRYLPSVGNYLPSVGNSATNATSATGLT